MTFAGEGPPGAVSEGTDASSVKRLHALSADVDPPISWRRIFAEATRDKPEICSEKRSASPEPHDHSTSRRRSKRGRHHRPVESQAAGQRQLQLRQLE